MVYKYINDLVKLQAVLGSVFLHNNLIRSEICFAIACVPVLKKY